MLHMNLNCRNVSMYIRFVLWIIDKYAGAGQLLRDEIDQLV